MKSLNEMNIDYGKEMLIMNRGSVNIVDYYSHGSDSINGYN